MSKEIECYLVNKCKAEHAKATNPIYLEKLYQVGKLFDGKPTCVWCLLHLQDMTKAPLNENDLRLEDLKVKFPGYAKVINEVGFDKVCGELSRTWTEISPDVPEKAGPTIVKMVGQRDRTWN